MKRLNKLAESGSMTDEDLLILKDGLATMKKWEQRNKIKFYLEHPIKALTMLFYSVYNYLMKSPTIDQLFHDTMIASNKMCVDIDYAYSEPAMIHNKLYVKYWDINGMLVKEELFDHTYLYTFIPRPSELVEKENERIEKLTKDIIKTEYDIPLYDVEMFDLLEEVKPVKKRKKRKTKKKKSK